MDIAPEHTKRGSVDNASVGDLHSDIRAAYDYVDSVIHTAHVTTPYAWHGWALREAFLAGISYAERTHNVELRGGPLAARPA